MILLLWAIYALGAVGAISANVPRLCEPDRPGVSRVGAPVALQAFSISNRRDKGKVAEGPRRPQGGASEKPVLGGVLVWGFSQKE